MAMAGARGGPRGIRWWLLPGLVLLALNWIYAQVSSCDGICGRRPLAVSQNVLRLVGGTNALPGTWPWQVSIQTKTRWGYYMHMCGGSLISSRWVVSAAHCFGKPKELYKLLLGCNRVIRPGPDAQQRFIKRVVKHKNVRSTLKTGGTIFNDIAVVELSEPVECSDYIQPACLPDGSLALPTLTHCYVSGWGNTNPKEDRYPDILQEAKVDFIPQWNCSQMWNRLIPTMNLCAGLEQGGIGTCLGDSGGPVHCREERSERFWVLGVLSWGPRNCGVAQKPSIFISLQYFRDWIEQNTQEDLLTSVRPPPLAQIPTTQPMLPPTTTVTTFRPQPLTWIPATWPTWAPTTKTSSPTPWLRPSIWGRPTYAWNSPWWNPTQRRPWQQTWPRTTQWYSQRRAHGLTWPIPRSRGQFYSARHLQP